MYICLHHSLPNFWAICDFVEGKSTIWAHLCLCTVCSYALLSICLSVCLSVTGPRKNLVLVISLVVRAYTWVFFKSTYMQMHDVLICIVSCLSVRLSGYVGPTLCTTSLVQSYVVHHWPALCTTELCCASWRTREGYFFVGSCSSLLVYTLVACNVALYWLGGTQDIFGCTLWATS